MRKTILKYLLNRKEKAILRRIDKNEKDLARAEKMLKLIKQLQFKCTCMTKTPDPKYHDKTCPVSKRKDYDPNDYKIPNIN